MAAPDLSCSTQDLRQHVGSSSLTRVQTPAPCSGSTGPPGKSQECLFVNHTQSTQNRDGTFPTSFNPKRAAEGAPWVETNHPSGMSPLDSAPRDLEHSQFSSLPLGLKDLVLKSQSTQEAIAHRFLHTFSRAICVFNLSLLLGNEVDEFNTLCKLAVPFLGQELLTKNCFLFRVSRISPSSAF